MGLDPYIGFRLFLGDELLGSANLYIVCLVLYLLEYKLNFNCDGFDYYIIRTFRTI
jgi:hypothetical protein